MKRLGLALMVLAAMLAAAPHLLAGGGGLRRITAAPDNPQKGGGFSPVTSSDGRVVAFTSPSPDLVPGDENGLEDVFVYDQATQRFELISIASNGTQGNDDVRRYQEYLAISGNGRYVAFTSPASNLVSGDTNNVCDRDIYYTLTDNCADVFVHDRVTKQTERVSVSSVGEQGNGISAFPSLSEDGRWVAFTGFAPLEPQDTNGVADVYLKDRVTGTLTRVSLTHDGAEANNGSDSPSLSADGRYVAFVSYATNLLPGDTGEPCRYPATPYNVFGATCSNIYRKDLQTGELSRVSAPHGVRPNYISRSPHISDDGRYIVFESGATNFEQAPQADDLEDIFLYDHQLQRVTRISTALAGGDTNDRSYGPRISGDGRTISFSSFATNIVAGDTNELSDVFMHDRETGQTVRVSVSEAGVQADSRSGDSDLSADGRFVVFESGASNLTTNDAPKSMDVFVWDREGSGSPVGFSLYLPLTQRR
jgi:Tol biopolymer transport system component